MDTDSYPSRLVLHRHLGPRPTQVIYTPMEQLCIAYHHVLTDIPTYRHWSYPPEEHVVYTDGGGAREGINYITHITHSSLLT